uniref:Putative plasmid partition protein ParA n=1 Tax=Leifsonia xyli subsp. cynodontis TaxID=31966 RepID=Q6EEG1_LEIXC|nr:putative plasmid partition protein ParA [Leifsonia xyli subsp. cynodontis]
MDRKNLQRVVAVINGKGGVGKTTITANVGGLLALSGWKVLIADLDYQANLGLDLGYQGSAGDDDGLGLAQALAYGVRPAILKDVRPNLDVIVGGGHVDGAAAALVSKAAQGKLNDARLSVAAMLDQVAGEYDIVLIDCPPGNDMLQSAAVAAARYVLIPVKTDDGSLGGMRITAGRLEQVIDLNPEMDLLGVIVFGSGTAATNVRREFTSQIVEALGGAVAGDEMRAEIEGLVFDSFLRHSEATAKKARGSGLLVHELDDRVKAAPKFWEQLKAGIKPQSAGPASAEGVADDLQAIAAELVARIQAKESEMSVVTNG